MEISRFILIIAVGFVAFVAKAGADLFVSPRGSDANSGTATAPFGTLEKARDAVRALAQGRGAARRGVNVVLLRGDYFRTNSLELNAADSGVAWQAEKGQRVRLLGGCSLADFQSVTNAALLARLSPSARTNVVQSKLVLEGSSRIGEMKSRGFARPTAPAQCELFFGRKPMTLARWPNEGEWEHIDGFPASDAHDDGHHGQIGKLEAGFLYSGERPSHWKDPTNVWIHGYWAWDWANSYERIAAFVPERHFIQTAPPYGNYGFRKGQRICFLNVVEELDQPGEWFFDKATATIYFWPPGELSAVDPGKVRAKALLSPALSSPNVGIAKGGEGDQRPPFQEVLLSLLGEPLLKLSNVSNLVVQGITFEAGRGNAIEIEGGTTNRISDCIIRNMGDWGVTIEGGFGHGVEHCEILDTGDGGVSLSGGDRRTLKPAGHFVEDCHFARQGHWSKCYVPAVLMSGVGLRVSRNLIHDHPHCAILYSGNDHLIELNEIHHIAMETGDVGAIYSGRDYTYRGNRIRHNFIHHTGGVGMGSMGIYMDDCVSGTEIYGNIFYKVQRAAFLGGGRDHQVINNIFVECSPAVELDGRGLDTSPVWRDMVDKTMRQRLAEIPPSLYRERYPEMKSLDRYYGAPEGPVIEGVGFKGVPPENNVVARNICVGKWLSVQWHADAKMVKVENNVTEGDPLFVVAPSDSSMAKDFALQQNSPVWKLGFERIPVDRIGPFPGHPGDMQRE